MPDAGAPTLRVCALYPDLMNIYADRGNLLLLERRCAWRGIGFELAAARRSATTIDPDAHDLFYLGGGQDRDQQLCAEDLVAHQARRRCTPPPRAAPRSSASAAATSCSATATSSATRSVPGVGLSTCARCARTAARLIGNVAIEVELPGLDRPRVLAGFENHGGRTHLGPARQPLGRVLRGHGNDGRSGFEGVRTATRDRHLPARPAAAEERLVRRLARDDGARPRRSRWPRSTTRLEDAAHAGARRAAGRLSGRIPASARLPRGSLPLISQNTAQAEGPSAYPQAATLEFGHVQKRYPGASEPAIDDLSLRGPRGRDLRARRARRAAARPPRCGWSTG